MATQGIQGHDIIPQQIFRDFGKDIARWLLGWSGSAEYNFGDGAGFGLSLRLTLAQGQPCLL